MMEYHSILNETVERFIRTRKRFNKDTIRLLDSRSPIALEYP